MIQQREGKLKRLRREKVCVDYSCLFWKWDVFFLLPWTWLIRKFFFVAYLSIQKCQNECAIWRVCHKFFVSLCRLDSDVCRKLRWRDYSVEQQHRKSFEETAATCRTRGRQEAARSHFHMQTHSITNTFAFIKSIFLAPLPVICLSYQFSSSILCLTHDFPGHFPDPHLGVNGKEDSDSSNAVTRLSFIPGRASVAAATGEIFESKQRPCNPHQPRCVGDLLKWVPWDVRCWIMLASPRETSQNKSRDYKANSFHSK